MSHFDADHTSSTGLQQAVGKAAGGLADVDGSEAFGVQCQCLENVLQLEGTAGHEAILVTGLDSEWCRCIQLEARLVHCLPATQFGLHTAFLDQPLCPCTCIGQTLFDQKDIQTLHLLFPVKTGTIIPQGPAAVSTNEWRQVAYYMNRAAHRC